MKGLQIIRWIIDFFFSLSLFLHLSLWGVGWGITIFLVLNMHCGKTQNTIFYGSICDKWASGTINKWNTRSSRPAGRCLNSRGCYTRVFRFHGPSHASTGLHSFQTMPALVRSLTGRRQHFYSFRVVFSCRQLSTCLSCSGWISGYV